MTPLTTESVLSLDRTVGRLESTVTDLKETVRLLIASIEADGRERKAECAGHWALTRKLEQDAILQRGTQESMLQAAATQREELATAERARREELAAAAIAAQSKVAIEAAEMAEFKASGEAARAAAIAVAEETALRVLANSARAAKETLATETGQRTQQRHWIIERVLPFAVPAATALAAWMIAKGG